MRCPRFIKMKQLKISKKPGISTSETNLHVLKKNNSKKFNGKCTLSSHLKTKLGECQLSLPAVRVCEVSKEERK